MIKLFNVFNKTKKGDLSPLLKGIAIVVWPDLTWAYVDELDQYSFMSDDFVIVCLSFDEEPSYDQLRNAIQNGEDPC